MARGAEVPFNLVVPIEGGRPGGALGLALERSRRLCLQRYEKELFTETSHLHVAERCEGRLTQAELRIFAGALHLFSLESSCLSQTRRHTIKLLE